MKNCSFRINVAILAKNLNMKRDSRGNLNNIIVERLKSYRLSKCINQKDFAFLISVSPSVYSRIESGKKEISLSFLQHIVEICQINLQDLFDFTNNLYLENNLIDKNINKTNLVLKLNLTSEQFEIIKSLILIK
jgi:transcriptional regulator with XRE-family HTH domain